MRVPPLTPAPRWVILAVTRLMEPPFHLCNGCLQFLPLPCDTNETELVTVSEEPQGVMSPGNSCCFL